MDITNTSGDYSQSFDGKINYNNYQVYSSEGKDSEIREFADSLKQDFYDVFYNE